MIITTSIIKKFGSHIMLLILTVFLYNCSRAGNSNFSTEYFKIQINTNGFITSMQNITKEPNREFSPLDKPSPLMQLYDGKKKIYYKPINAKFNQVDQTIALSYPNGSVAQIILTPHKIF